MVDFHLPRYSVWQIPGENRVLARSVKEGYFPGEKGIGYLRKLYKQRLLVLKRLFVFCTFPVFAPLRVTVYLFHFNEVDT